MDLLATSTPLLLINLLFAGIALTVGFAAGAWFFGGAPASDADDAAERRNRSAQSEADLIERERTALVSDRLRDLASNVASDVGEHSASIERIGAELAEARDDDGQFLPESVIHAVQEISRVNSELQQRLEKAEQQIESQAEEIRAHESAARTDSLTRLANRRAFDDELMRRVAEFRRLGTPVSLLILDVDHFKKFNDTHGHQAGDEVLRSVGRALLSCAREMDLPCRYGGEEFAVVLPATTVEDGAIVAERIRVAIEQLSVRFDDKNLSVTVSLGLAQAAAEEQPESIVKRADEALYQSKDAGRNNAHRHDGVRSFPITPGMDRPAQAAAEPKAAETLPAEAIANRTRFLEELRQQIRVAESSGATLTVLAAELEGHTRIRREFGDEVGQLTVDSVGQFIENTLRDADFIGRLGEGRFGVVMPETSAASAEDFAGGIRTALSGFTVPLGDEKLQLATRMTIAELEPEDSEVTLMRRVEAAMDVFADDAEPTAVV